VDLSPPLGLQHNTEDVFEVVAARRGPDPPRGPPILLPLGARGAAFCF